MKKQLLREAAVGGAFSMDDATLKVITGLTGAVGIPGALLLMAGYLALKALPTLLNVLERTAKSLEEIAKNTTELRRDIDLLRTEFRGLSQEMARQREGT